MKIGNTEGTPEEIKDFFENNSLNIIDYLEKPDQPLKPVWFIVPVSLVIAALLCLTLLAFTLTSVRTLVFLLGCSAGFWLAVNVQIRFKNAWATFFVAVGTVLVMLVAIGMVAPIDMLQHLKELRK
jgi:uncharacterized membrane protein